MISEKLKTRLLFINTYLPYVFIGALGLITVRDSIIPAAFMILACVVVINTLFAWKIKNRDPFTYGPVAPIFLGALLLLVDYPHFLYYWNHLDSVSYASLFCSAFFPPAFGLKPFTMRYSESKYPKFIVESHLFKKINLIITHVWSVVFLVSIFLSLPVFTVTDSYHAIVTIGGPLLLMGFIAIPATIILPGFLQKVLSDNTDKSSYVDAEIIEMSFESVRELLDNMPMGFSKSRSEGVNFSMQLHITGIEKIDACLEIRNKKCTLKYGINERADTIVRVDSQLWLDIVNRKVSGEKALKDGRYTVKGDLNNLILMETLFPSPARQNKQNSTNNFLNDFNYGVLKPNEIKQILVIDGGPRGKNYSKSSYMARHFCRGAVSAGASVEYIELKKKHIRGGCLGCYHCWTKEPGTCIQKDDMQDLLRKLSKSDLVVFVSPLYYFSVTAQLKIFIDRMIPNLLPWLENKNNMIGHPARVPFPTGKGWVVFSAGAFTQVSNNFDGISAIFRILHKHTEGNQNGRGGLLGEFFLPASEEISVPAFRNRKKLVVETCHQAGKDIVLSGKIDKKLMDRIADPMTAPEDFMDHANNFWEESVANRSFLKTIPHLEKVEV